MAVIVLNSKITLLNDQRPTSGTFNYCFQIYRNLIEHGLQCDFHQFLVSNEILQKMQGITSVSFPNWFFILEVPG